LVLFRVAFTLVLVGGAARPRPRRLRARAGSRPWARAARWLTLYFVAAFVAWYAGVHYYRYFVAGEFLVPAVIAGLLAYAVPGRRLLLVWPGLALLIVLTTQTLSWGRVPWQREWYRVRMDPAAVPRGTVVFVAGGLLSYTLPFFPDGTRFFGLIGHQTEGFHGRIARELQNHRGEILLLSRPDNPMSLPLGLLGLRRTRDCTAVRAKPGESFDLCRLARVRRGEGGS
jgi:hypothetical protein